MCLWAYQKEGNRVAIVTEAMEAFRAGDLETTNRLYNNVTGKNIMEHNKTLNNPWIQYCMGQTMLSHIDWERPEFQKLGTARHCDDMRYYQSLKRVAEKTYGGVWDIAYEY